MRVEVIVPKELIDTERMMRAIDNTLDQQAAAVKSQFNVTTMTWKNRPTFLMRTTPGIREIYTTDLIYKYVSEGTKPHIIVPRNAKALHFFATGFRAKTRIRVIERSNIGATATQDETFTQLVHHPGTEAREFAEAIAEKWQDELPKQLQRAIDAEANRV